MKCTPEVLQKIYEEYPHLTVMEFVTLMWLHKTYI